MNDTQRANDRSGPDNGLPRDPAVRHAEGGDPACWLDQVCADCGRIADRPGGDGCPYCGSDATPDNRDGTPGDTTPVPPASAERRAARRRDRDEEGRARNARPRDGLGRPLPYGAPGVARQPEGVPRAPSEALAEAQRLLDAGMPFHAHEVLEDAWKAAPESERELWRGLAQLAVGLTHAARGNTTGGVALLDRGAAALAPSAGPPPHGIDIGGLVVWARELTDRLRQCPGVAIPAAPNAPRLRAGDR